MTQYYSDGKRDPGEPRRDPAAELARLKEMSNTGPDGRVRGAMDSDGNKIDMPDDQVKAIVETFGSEVVTGDEPDCPDMLRAVAKMFPGSVRVTRIPMPLKRDGEHE